MSSYIIIREPSGKVCKTGNGSFDLDLIIFSKFIYGRKMSVAQYEFTSKFQNLSSFNSKLLEKCVNCTFFTKDCIMGIFISFILYKIFSSRSFKQTYDVFWRTDAEVVWQKLLEYLSYSDSTPRLIKMAFFRFVIVNQPEDIQTVLNGSLKKSNFYKLFQNAVGDGLFTAAVEKWKIHRRVIRPTFNMAQLEKLFPVFNFKTQILISNLSTQSDTDVSFDLWKYLYSDSLSSICETLMNFHIHPNDIVGEEFGKALLKVTEADVMRIYKIWLQPEIVFKVFAYFSGIFGYFRTFRQLPHAILRQGKEKYKRQATFQNGDKDDAKGFFVRTLFSHRENGFEFSEQDIFDEIITMLIGGSEATALTLCFTLLMLGVHPDIQERVYKDTAEIIGEGNQFVDLEQVQCMSYLEQCIKETLRLFPVGPLLLRETTKNIALSRFFENLSPKGNNTIIPAGSNIIIPVIKIHRDARVFDNPLEWNPENFSAEAVSKRHKATFLGFSAGPRGCIGSTYALFSMKVTLSLLLLHYKIKTDIKMEDIRLKVDLMLRSASGFPIKFYRRIKE